MNKADILIQKYIESDKSIDEFLEIESTDIAVTPEKSPLPSKKDDKDEEDE